MLRNILLSACVLSCANFASAQTGPQVAFIGDTVTYNWQVQPQFAANPNWTGYGADIPMAPGAGRGTSAAITQLQQVIAGGKKPIVHLLVGQADEDGTDAGGNQAAVIFAAFATNFEKIITTAQGAGLKIIVGTIPYSAHGSVTVLNEWIFAYCNAHDIPVINYAFALNSGTGFAADRGPTTPVYYNNAGSSPVPTLPTLTSAGYDLITDMAQTEIGLVAGSFSLTGGYLQDVALEDLEDAQSQVNQNTVVDGSTVQFTPWGEFSDGSARIMNNADQDGHVGLWTSSTPEVVTVDQHGVGTSFSHGSSNVHFVSNSGIQFSEWIENVNVDDPSGGSLSNY
jgi:hypothetical protein